MDAIARNGRNKFEALDNFLVLIHLALGISGLSREDGPYGPNPQSIQTGYHFIPVKVDQAANRFHDATAVYSVRRCSGSQRQLARAGASKGGEPASRLV